MKCFKQSCFSCSRCFSWGSIQRWSRSMKRKYYYFSIAPKCASIENCDKVKLLDIFGSSRYSLWQKNKFAFGESLNAKKCCDLFQTKLRTSRQIFAHISATAEQNKKWVDENKMGHSIFINHPFLQYRKYPRYLQKLTLGLIRPKQKFLGLRLAFTSVYDIFCIGKTMTYDLCFVPASYPVFDYNLLLHRTMSLNMQWIYQVKKLKEILCNFRNVQHLAFINKRIPSLKTTNLNPTVEQLKISKQKR